MTPEEFMLLKEKINLDFKSRSERLRASLTKRELEVLDMRFGLDSEVPDAERATTAQINAAAERALERLRSRVNQSQDDADDVV